MEAARAVGLVGRAAIQKASKPDERCTPEWVRGPLLEWFCDPAGLAAAANAAAAWGIRDADERVADLIERAASSGSDDSVATGDGA